MKPFSMLSIVKVFQVKKNSLEEKRAENRLWLAGTLALHVCLLPLPATADDKKEAEREAALKAADENAFAENMAAFKDQVFPALKQHCVECHGEKKQKGDLNLLTLDPDMKLSGSAARWAAVREALEMGDMPPEDKPRPSVEMQASILDWIRQEMKRGRRTFARRHQVVHGNEMPHAKLFDPTFEVALKNPPRIRQIRPEMYQSFRGQVAKGFEGLIGNPFSPGNQFVFRDMGMPIIDEPTTAQLFRNAVTIVERQTGHTIENGKLTPMVHSRKEFLEFIDPAKPLGEADMARAVDLQFQRVLSRRPSEEERIRFVALMQQNVKDAGRTIGVRYALAAVFLLPEAVFRWEVGGKPDDHGRSRLTPPEIASALAFALGDQQPPENLVKAAQTSQLDTEAGVISAVENLLSEKRFKPTRLLGFFREFFLYDRADEVFKEPKDFSAHKARVLISDTDNLVRWVLKQDEHVLKTLLTTDYTFVNTRYDEQKQTVTVYESKGDVHLSYSLPPDWKWTAEQPIRMQGIRAGILTQPAWLVAWSQSDDNHAILRGKFVRERLLGNVVPDLPITVDAQLPQEETTLRHRMRVTEETYCWKCHVLMNDVGYPFENYDHFGRWRSKERDEPVNATGLIAETGDPELDGTRVTNALAYARILGESKRVEQVFIRHAFRYFLGRNENLGDARTLRNAQAAYRDNNGSFQALLISLLSSDSFLYRTPGGATVSN